MSSIEKQNSKMSDSVEEKTDPDPSLKPDMNYDTLLIWESILFPNKNYESKLVQQAVTELETAEINK